MTENLKGKATTAVEDGRAGMKSTHNNTKNPAHAMHKDSGVTAQHIHVQEKSGTHHAISAEPNAAAHTLHKDAEMKAQHVSTHEKSGAHKEVEEEGKAASHSMHKDAGMKASDLSAHEKSGSHKDSAELKATGQPVHKDTDLKNQHVSTPDKSGAHKAVSSDATVDAYNKKQIHAQIAEALSGAKFPVKTSADLISAFPKGAATKCHAGDFSMTVGEAGKLLKATDFPFKNANAVADLIVDRATF